VPIQRPDPDAGTLRHRLQARLGAALAEHRLCRLQHALAIADGIRARLSFFQDRLIRHRVRTEFCPL
jgi:hypothetical protein